MPSGLDLKQLSQWKNTQLKQLQELSKNWDVYEKRVREAVRELDLRSQQARKLSEARLRDVSDHIRRTRGDVEKRVRGLLESEAKKLNVQLRKIYTYLVKVAQEESNAKKKSKKASTGHKTKRKTTPRKNRAPSVRRVATQPIPAERIPFPNVHSESETTH